MKTIEEIRELMSDLESDRIERTVSFRMDKLGPAVCAFSNDFANHKQPGYILLGVEDEGKVKGMSITDQLLLQIGDVKSNGNVLPQPSMLVSEVFKIDGGDVVLVEVSPSLYPPVRYDGRCHIRIGPRKSLANVDEERILSERRASYAKTYDLSPARGRTIDDLSIDHFKLSYLPLAIDRDTLEANGRSIEEQMSALRFYDLKEGCPTYAGILLFGINPLFDLPGAYMQYIKFSGTEMTSNVEQDKEFSGALITELKNIDDFVKYSIIKKRPVKTNSFQEQLLINYPYWALRELLMNAIMHRSYETNSPIYIYEFSDRIEIHNSGGLFGDVNPENFPNASGYRNVVLAEALKQLGYVNKFNYGVKKAIDELLRNGNELPIFELTLITKFKVSIPINKQWQQ